MSFDYIERISGHIFACHIPDRSRPICVLMPLDTPDPQALALPKCIKRKPLVYTNLQTLFCQNRTWLSRQIAVEKLSERSFTDKANPRRVLFRCIRQAKLKCDAPDLSFIDFT